MIDNAKELELLQADSLIRVLRELQNMLKRNVGDDLSRIENGDEIFGLWIVLVLEEVNPRRRVEGDVFRLNHRCRGAVHSCQ